jgi:uncharacterized LabA/DUF88 family protein
MIALFIDAGYLDKLCQEIFATVNGGRKVPLPLDFKQLPAYLAGAKPGRTFYYYCLPYQDDPPLPAQFAAAEAKKRFIGFLDGRRWITREGRLEKRKDAYIQKRVDVMLAVDLTRLAWKQEITRAVLLTGDADFVPAVEDARAAGVEVVLRYAPGTAHQDLIAACNRAEPLTREGLEALRLA